MRPAVKRRPEVGDAARERHGGGGQGAAAGSRGRDERRSGTRPASERRPEDGDTGRRQQVTADGREVAKEWHGGSGQELAATTREQRRQPENSGGKRTTADYSTSCACK